MAFTFFHQFLTMNRKTISELNQKVLIFIATYGSMAPSPTNHSKVSECSPLAHSMYHTYTLDGVGEAWVISKRPCTTFVTWRFHVLVPAKTADP